MSDLEEWVCDSNDALSLRLGRWRNWLTYVRFADAGLVRSHEDAGRLAGKEVTVVEPFHPAFTYPIFGEKEVAFGYKNLDIQVSTAYCALLTDSYRSPRAV